ncbi:hypothetical protein D558_0122 [Bordetella holmesii 44057]|nr:hypothetical protein D558_0122 [Bordetella holmesii 44057]
MKDAGSVKKACMGLKRIRLTFPKEDLKSERAAPSVIL